MDNAMKCKWFMRYNQIEIRLERVEDVIREIKKIKMTQSQEQQYLMIEMMNKSINIVLTKGGQCTLLIRPTNSSEDSEITYNKALDPEGIYTNLNVKGEYSFSFTKYHLINFEDGLIELRNILENRKQILEWHVY